MTDELEVPAIAGNVDYVLSDGAGRIVQAGSVPASMLDAQRELAPEGGALAKGRAGPDSSWVTNGQLTARPANTASLDGMTLRGVPAGATVTIEGTDYTVSDGTVELSFSHAGVYTVTVQAWPMLDATFQVTQA